MSTTKGQPQKKPSASKKPSKRAAKNAVTAAKARVPQVTEHMKEIEEVLLSYASPMDYPVQRVASGTTSHKTAIAKCFYRQTAGFGIFSDMNHTNGPPTGTAAFAFRDPCRSLVTPVPINLGEIYRYTSPTTNQTASTASTSPWYPYLLPDSTSKKVHGEALYPGLADGSRRQYWWMSKNSVLTFYNNTALAISFGVYEWRRGVEIRVGASNANAGSSGVFNPTTDGYFGIDIGAAGTTTGPTQIEITGQGGFVGDYIWGHFGLPFNLHNLPSVDAVRINAVSLMYTNEAAPINKQGKIAGCQLPRGRHWQDFINYDSVSNLSDSASLTAENGMYGFLKPTQPEDFNFKDFDSLTTLGVSTMYYRLSPDSDFLVLAASITTVAGQDGYFTPVWALEFRTVDQWRETRRSNLGPDDTALALGMLARMPQWHENPFHLSDITDWLKDRASDLYNYVKSNLPGVVNTATTVAKIGGALIPLL